VSELSHAERRIAVAGAPLRCPFCHGDIDAQDDRWRACAECLARHHEACWRELGWCGSCGGTRSLEPARAKLEAAGARPGRRVSFVKQLTVIYDSMCGLCQRIRIWLERQPKFVPLEFVGGHSADVARRFPGVERPGPQELIVISDEGGVYRGAQAWIMCLWALREYREWSIRLARPALLPFARRAFELFSENRFRIARWLGLETDQELSRRLAAAD
jgi:predicted DCC family thiol-disulfide oxidoreductase YuxK